MALLRAFVAITLPPDLQDSLAAQTAPLKEVIPRVEWVKATNLHMTLKFLGNVEEEAIGPIVCGLTTAAAQVEAFDLDILELGVFPTLARPRVIWIGASGPRLSALVESIESALEPLGFPRETRPFSAHITLGRVRPFSRNASDGGPRKAIGGPPTPTDTGSRPPVPISQIVLMRSRPSPSGVTYTELAAFSLASPR
jgi:RNA 2',3'-cyclic 3'-phosphodiesterase